MVENIEYEDAPETSDYKDWLTMGLKPQDLIPVAGFFIGAERSRKELGKSFVDLYIRDLLNPKALSSIGTYKWPKPADKKASWRATGLAARNTLLAYYHIGIPVFCICYSAQNLV